MAKKNALKLNSTGLKQGASTGEYIANVLRESFKQNFLGYDINMEFLTLTVRNYATASVKAIRHLAAKTSKSQSNISQTSI